MHYTALHYITLVSCSRLVRLDNVIVTNKAKIGPLVAMGPVLFLSENVSCVLEPNKMQLAELTRKGQSHFHMTRIPIPIPSSRPALQYDIRSQHPDSICGLCLCKIE